MAKKKVAKKPVSARKKASNKPKKSKKKAPVAESGFVARSWGILLVWLVVGVGLLMAWLLSSEFTRERLGLHHNVAEEQVLAVLEQGVAEERLTESRWVWQWWQQVAGGEGKDMTPLLYPEQDVYAQLQQVEEALAIQPTAKALLIRKMVLLEQLNRVDEASLVLDELRLLDPNDAWIRDYTLVR